MTSIISTFCFFTVGVGPYHPDIKCNIDANLKMFGGTKVMPMMLHWNQTEVSEITNSYDIIVASDWYLLSSFMIYLVGYEYINSF